MRKITAFALSLILALSVSVTAFAAETSTGGGDTNIPVTGQYQAGAVSAEVISVDLAWDAMDFTYTAPSRGDWNPQTHEYENVTAGGWAPATTGTDPKITVTNHSNAEITAGFAFNGAVEGLNGSFTKTALVLRSAEGTEVANAPKGETVFSVSGSSIDADKNLGTITVTVGKFDTTPKEISTADELLATADKVGVFQLANDIDLGGANLETASAGYVLDLNGHTLTSSSTEGVVEAREGAVLTVKNGSLTNTADCRALFNTGGTVTIDGCTLSNNGAYYAIESNGKLSVKDSVLHGLFGEQYTVMIENLSALAGKYGELTLSGNVEMDGSINVFKYRDPVAPTVKALAGTYNFDVSSYVDTTLYDVTNDGAAWVVTAK